MPNRLWTGQAYEPVALQHGYAAGRRLAARACEAIERGKAPLRLAILFATHGFGSHRSLIEGVQDGLKQYIEGRPIRRRHAEGERRAPVVPLIGCTACGVVVDGEPSEAGAALCVMASDDMEAVVAATPAPQYKSARFPSIGAGQFEPRALETLLRHAKAFEMEGEARPGFALIFLAGGGEPGPEYGVFEALTGILPRQLVALGITAAPGATGTRDASVRGRNRGQAAVFVGSEALCTHVGIAIVRSDLQVCLHVGSQCTPGDERYAVELHSGARESSALVRALYRVGEPGARPIPPQDFAGTESGPAPLLAIPREAGDDFVVRPRLQPTDWGPMLYVQHPVRPEWLIRTAKVTASDIRGAATKVGRSLSGAIGDVAGTVPLVVSCEGKWRELGREETTPVRREEIGALTHELPGCVAPFGCYGRGEYGYAAPHRWAANYALGVLAIGDALSAAAEARRAVRAVADGTLRLHQEMLSSLTEGELVERFFDLLAATPFQGGLVSLLEHGDTGPARLRGRYARNAVGTRANQWKRVVDATDFGIGSSHAPAKAIVEDTTLVLPQPEPALVDTPLRAAGCIEGQVVVPLRPPMGPALGCLQVGFPLRTQPSPPVVAALEGFAASLASGIALHRRRTLLADRVRHIAYQARSVQSGLEFDKLTDYVAQIAAEVTGSTYASLRLLTQDGRRLVFAGTWSREGAFGAQELARSYSVPETLAALDLSGSASSGAKVVLTKAYHLHNEAREDPYYAMLFDDVGAHLVVPIEMAEEVMGVLTVNHTGEAKYDAQDLHALLLLGSEVATAVTLARSRLRWVTVSKVLRAFLGVGLEPPTPDASLQAALAEALPLVAQHIRTALRCRSVLVFAASPQAPRDYHLLARQGKPLADLSEPVYVQGSPTLVGRAAAGPVSLVAERNEGAIERLAAVVQDHRRRAMAVVVCAGKTKPGGFTDDDQLLLGEVAEMSEIGFGHARSLDRVRRWLAASLARHATHQHQLVKPFAAIDKALREMKPQPPGVAEAIARMNEVREVTSTLLRLEQLERGAPDAWKETFHPLGVLGQVADDERERGRGIGVTLEVRSPIPEVAAIGDEGLVREALRCLVDNALKFCSRPGRAVLACREAESAGPPGGGAFAPDGLGGGVEVETWGQALVVGERTGLLPGTCTLVSVENTGPRIPEDLRGIIFTQGYSTTPKADKSRWGFGFGLSIVYQVADVHGGGVVVQNMPDGVKFTLVLPH